MNSYYNPLTGETKTRAELKTLFHSSIPLNLNEINGWVALSDTPAYPENCSFDSDTMQVTGTEIVQDGDIYIRRYIVEDLPLDEAKQRLLSKVADLRWQVETSGIELAGMQISTDRQSQAMITQTVAGLELANASENPIPTVRFKAESGFVELTAEQISAIGLAVTRHVEHCYNREAELYEAIVDAESVEELRELDLSF